MTSTSFSLVMPGLCAGHPRLGTEQTQRRGWPGQARPWRVL